MGKKKNKEEEIELRLVETIEDVEIKTYKDLIKKEDCVYTINQYVDFICIFLGSPIAILNPVKEILKDYLKTKILYYKHKKDFYNLKNKRC